MKKIKWRLSDYLEPFIGKVAEYNNLSYEEVYDRVCLVEADLPIVYDELSSSLTNAALKLYNKEQYAVTETTEGFKVIHTSAFTARGASELYRTIIRVHLHGDKKMCDDYLKEKRG